MTKKQEYLGNWESLKSEEEQIKPKEESGQVETQLSKICPAIANQHSPTFRSWLYMSSCLEIKSYKEYSYKNC